MMPTLPKGNRVILAEDPDLRRKIFLLRHEVFVQEQQVDARDEFDQYEETSRHFAAINAENEVVGTARWRKTNGAIKLERFAVRKDLRRSGIGAMLVEAVLLDIQAREGNGQLIYLHSQVAAIPFYLQFGFTTVGARFEECNIWHQRMERMS